VRVTSSLGAHYLEYTYAPTDRILNGEIQALVGLYEYTSITKDPTGLALFEAGDAEERARTPLYNTGYWSMYDQYGESDLNYHELLTEFLQHLCERTSKGPPFTPTGSVPGTPSTPSTTTTTTAPSSSTGGASAGSTARAASIASTVSTVSTASAAARAGNAASSVDRARLAQSSGGAGVQIPGDQIYCTTAQHFTADLRTPPVVSLLSKTLAAGARAGVQLSLSKISNVTLTVRQGSKVVWRNSAEVERGKPRLLWITPQKGGTFTVELTATDLAGNFSTTSGTVVVTRH
jgi:hypothetical protein